jgi:hypothetical protein
MSGLANWQHIRARLGVYGPHIAEVEAVRREGLTLPLTNNEIEPVFALGFALEQLRQNFIDLQRCVQDYARPGRKKIIK